MGGSAQETTSTPQLLHLWFKKEHRRRDKKNERAEKKKQVVCCKTVTPGNGCMNRVWKIIIPTDILSWKSGDYTVSYP